MSLDKTKIPRLLFKCGALALCLFFFTMPLIAIPQRMVWWYGERPGSVSAWLIAIPAGGSESVFLVFIMLIIPIVISLMALGDAYFETLRTASVVGLVAKIIFMLWMRFWDDDAREAFRYGYVEFTPHIWIVLATYIGLVVLAHYCANLERETFYANKTQNTKTCSNCGQTYSEASIFCTNCGHRQSSTFGKHAPLITCSNCGKTHDVSCKFCPHCAYRCTFANDEKKRVFDLRCSKCNTFYFGTSASTVCPRCDCPPSEFLPSNRPPSEHPGDAKKEDIVTCSKCKKTYDATGFVSVLGTCTECGQGLHVGSTDGWWCTQCGNRNLPDYLFCEGCGKTK